MMESYDDFIQGLKMRETDEDDGECVITPSSLIVFHGVCVLPPLLSEQQREDMRSLRQTAVSLMKSSRKQQECHTFETVSADVQSHITSTEQQISDDVTQHEEIFTSAAQPRAFPADDGSDIHSDKHPHGDISHQMMMSSGYVTNENTSVKTPDVTFDSSWMENNQTSAGFCLNTTQSISTGSDIISHAPVDGSVLEEENAAPASEPVNPPSEPEADEGPYRTSLQNLLKKSQDYRRRQRLLRSRARALESTDEHSLSDKENQEFPPKQTWKTELKNARERRKVKTQPLDAEAAEACTDVCHTAAEISEETCDGSVSYGRPDEHHDTENIHDPLQSTSTQLPVTGRSVCLSTLKAVSVSKTSSAAAKRFTSVPAPKFCLSPVHSTKGSSVPARVRKAVRVDAESDPNRPGDGHGNVLGSVNDGGMLANSSSVQTEQITQLELNLSSLKALISDLESTLTLSQTDDDTRAITDHKTHQQREITNCHPSQTFSHKHSVHSAGRSTQPVLTDSSNQSEKTRDSLTVSFLCQSYDVDVPSSLWTQDGQLTPETGGLEGVSRAKRRLLMNEMDTMSPGRAAESPGSSTPTALQSSAQLQPEDQVRVLLEDERRRQQDVLQSLAVRYQFLRSVSLQRPSTGSRLEDVSTSSVSAHAAFPSPSHALHTSRVRPATGTTQSQNKTSDICSQSVCLSVCVSQQSCLSLSVSCRPLLAAAVKGYLTRRLLRTERLSQLIRTIQDTQQFLHQTAVRGEFSSRQDLMLQDRVMLQLRAARYEFHDIIFNSGICERMKMIRQDKEVTRERRFRQHSNKVKGSLSAATRKALERRKLATLRRKSTDRTTFSPSAEGQWTLVPKICRVLKKTSPRSTRPVRCSCVP